MTLRRPLSAVLAVCSLNVLALFPAGSALPGGGTIPALPDVVSPDVYALAGQKVQPNLALAREIRTTLADPALAPETRLLAAVDVALRARADAIPDTAGSPLPGLIARERENLQLAERLLVHADGASEEGFAAAVAAAKETLITQARALDSDASPLLPHTSHALPSEAILDLLRRFPHTPSPKGLSGIGALDQLEPSLRDAITSLVDAFAAYDDATRSAFRDANLGARESSLLPGSASPAPAEFRVQLAPVLLARLALLDAAVRLEQAVAQSERNDGSLPPPLLLPPALAIDVSKADNVYRDDVALLVDAGGDDIYLNNAGGSNLHGGLCAIDVNGAALVDLKGDDQYPGIRGCGARGGAFGGAGLLLDAAGDDTYGGAPSEQARGPAFGLPAETVDALTPSQPGETSSAEEARFLVGFADPTLAPAPGDIYAGARVVSVNPALRFFVVEPDDVESFPARVGQDPNVRYVERDGPVHVLMEPNDPLFSQQYAPVQVRATKAWDVSVGAPTRTICVADTGVMATHEDLQGPRLLGGFDFINGDADAADDNGHGTHVTGIAAATTGNGIGIAGIAQAGILVAKVLDASGRGTFQAAADGIQWCADQGAHVISMSFGSSVRSQAIADAVVHAWNRGALLVAAAGNAGCFDCIRYPAAFPEVIAVTCTTPDRTLCSFSSHGRKAELAAPGLSVLSTYSKGPDYVTGSGTSMSAPHVSGAAALVWANAPHLTNAQLRQLLRDTAQGLGALGCDARLGHGIVDVKAALDAALAGAEREFRGREDCVADLWGVNGGARSAGAGFLLDAAGDDRYQAGWGGANGGGYQLGMGFLLDAKGDDVYAAGNSGTNGGGEFGQGVLVDLAGDDVYTAGTRGTNGGGVIQGAGFLVDASGADTYTAADGKRGETFGKNGGAFSIATGFLLDRSGDDTYAGGSDATNGGGDTLAIGLLVDVEGNDVYLAGGRAANGGGTDDGTGFLVDGAGADRYVAGSVGTNGGYSQWAVADGVGSGFLLDVGGDDTYSAGYLGVNGGGYALAPLPDSTELSSGFLLDMEGNDRYVALALGVNGGGYTATGFLADVAGSDEYTAQGGATNGGGALSGTGALVDDAGDDLYQGGLFAANGGSGYSGSGLLYDGKGDDRYEASWGGVNGGVYNVGTALLLDAGGSDSYQDDDGGTGEDRTVLPKGTVGAQVDFQAA